MVEVFDNGSSIGTVRANSAGAWSLQASSIASGAHSITARQTDIAGNLSAASTAMNFTVDSTAMGLPALAAASDSGAAGNGAGRPSLPPSAATGHPIAHVFEPATASKYRNVKTNGYASKREAKRAAALKAMEAAGLISDLREQVTYLIVPKAIGADGKVVERAAHYVADFVYRNGLGHEIVEDCKGMRTDVYRLKRKLMLMVHGIRILET